MSADVELNPGPLTDKDEVLREIRSSKDDLMGELKTVKHDIRTLTEDMDILKTSQTKLKSDVADVQIIQCKLETRIADLETSVDRLKHDNDALKQENELLQLDIDDLSDQVTAKTKLIDALDKDIDQLEAYSRRDTVRVFGLPEMLNESYETIKQYVIDSVLKVARPDINWSPDDIVRTHRIGTKIESRNEDDEDTSNDKPRILLIKFHHWDKKMMLFKGRETLRSVGIRIGDDLTRRQRHALQRLADQGKFGYFYKGKLYVKEQSENTDRPNRSRTFRKAARKLPVGIDKMDVTESGSVGSAERVENDGALELPSNMTA